LIRKRCKKGRNGRFPRWRRLLEAGGGPKVGEGGGGEMEKGQKAPKNAGGGKNETPLMWGTFRPKLYDRLRSMGERKERGGVIPKKNNP